MRAITALIVFAVAAVALPQAGRCDPAIDKDTKCQTIVDYLDNKDSSHAQEAYRAAKQLMGELDKAAAAKGQDSLIDPLTPEHTQDVYILVLESCRDYPRQTLGQTAADTYDGLRDLRAHPPTR